MLKDKRKLEDVAEKTEDGWRLGGLEWKEGEEPLEEIASRIVMVGGYVTNPPPYPSRRDTSLLLLDHNSLQILEALYRQGSYPVYAKPNGDLAMYSEHAGVLTVRDGTIDQVITSTHSYRIDTTDDSIYLPCNTDVMYQHPYLFHTHPMQSVVGGRAEAGIIYELPSPGDIFNFVHMAEKGKAQASIIVSPEGLYVIRKIFPDQSLTVQPDDYLRIQRIIGRVEDFTLSRIQGQDLTDPETFQSQVCQHTDAIRRYNRIVRKMGIWTEYYPREYCSERGHTILPQIWLWHYAN